MFVDRVLHLVADRAHIESRDPETVIVEAHTGGRCFERARTDGVRLGRVTAHEPPGRLVIAWELDADFEHDPASATEVEVRFISEGPSTTRVELEHRGLEIFAERAEELRRSIGGPQGWPGILERYAAAARPGWRSNRGDADPVRRV